MNRALRRGMNKTNALRKKRGGGVSLYGPVVPFNPKNDWEFSVGRGEINHLGYNDCYFNARPGELFNYPNLPLIQTPMAGGRRKSRRARRGGGCGCMPQMGGRRTRRMAGGGTNGFSTDPNNIIGGNGPIAVPTYDPVPCDGRISAVHALNPPGPFLEDPRAPADLYSLYPNPPATPPVGYSPELLYPSASAGNQTATQNGGRRTRRLKKKVRGGEYSSGNNYPEKCYHAPGSSLPVYNASDAGFYFTPSTNKGVFEPDGVVGFMEVNPTAARVGGGRRKSRRHRRHRKAAKKSKRSRKH
jgi:hypothetical protein